MEAVSKVGVESSARFGFGAGSQHAPKYNRRAFLLKSYARADDLEKRYLKLRYFSFRTPFRV